MLASPSARAASDTPDGLDELAALPIQSGGRVMPLRAYANRLAVQLTGRTHWSATDGPEAFAGRTSMQLFCDLAFRGNELPQRNLIAVENRPFKELVGLESGRRFFTPAELIACSGVAELLAAFDAARKDAPETQPTTNQRHALDIREAVDRVVALANGVPLSIIPTAPGQPFRSVGLAAGDPGASQVRAALKALGAAYVAGRPITAEVSQLRDAIRALGTLTSAEAQRVWLELFYENHKPYRMTAVFYTLSLVLFGISRLALRKPLIALAVLAAAAGIAEHVLGLSLRVMILVRPPVSNSYESLLWMGLVAIAIGAIAQVLNRKAWYLVAGVAGALVSVLFAGLIPLQDRTNALPAVLRSNFWLTIHVLTIVASYGVLTVAAVFGHVYLVKEVLLRPRARQARPTPLSAPLIVQTYRTIQVGLVLLTIGTILGGVWASESWGRFWGWDPKETWALISILTYFAILHARYVQWIRDFGLAASAILAFVVVVWTFYGVNYVMATGLHSYGFGSGGEAWVAIWAVAEVLLLIVCRVRLGTAPTPPPSPIEGAPAPLSH